MGAVAGGCQGVGPEKNIKESEEAMASVSRCWK